MAGIGAAEGKSRKTFSIRPQISITFSSLNIDKLNNFLNGGDEKQKGGERKRLEGITKRSACGEHDVESTAKAEEAENMTSNTTLVRTSECLH